MSKSRNRTGKFLLPCLTLFCISTTARDGAGLGFFFSLSPNSTSHSVTSLPQHPLTEIKMKRLCWVVSECHLCLAQRLLLSLGSQLPALLFCFTHAVTGTALNIPLGADLKVPKT